MTQGGRWKLALGVLLAASIVKLWLLPLPSSFWVDEMVTAFVVHQGAAHASFAVAPQVTASVYYWLPWAAERIFGFSEVSYRISSILLMGGALFLLALLAMRLIHPEAGWFAIFAALTLRGINYEAADARPYALAMLVSAAALWFLVRWLDSARWQDAAGFVFFAALLWRVHLINWPFYAVFVAYAAARLARRDTTVSWKEFAGTFAVLGLTLAPVLFGALALFRNARAHVIAEHPPSLRELGNAFKFLLVAGCGVAGWLLSRRYRWPRQTNPSVPVLILVLGWWAWHPAALYAFSWITGASVFVPRYLSLSLPGAALAGTLAAAYFVPAGRWLPATTVFAVGVLLFVGDNRRLWPPHHNSDWRAASQAIHQAGTTAATPVLYPSPFIEAKSPIWRPDYPLPSFLYCHLETYPIAGKPFLLPFEMSPEAERYAASIVGTALTTSGRFYIYGGDINVHRWQAWFGGREELHGWQSRRLGPFGDVDAVLFERTP